MDKFVKINSVQGSDFTKAQNLVDFVIPSGMGVVNLRDSYINLNVKVNVAESNTDTGVGVYPAGVEWADVGGVHPHYTNTALVKNCSLKSALKGQIENLRRVDQFSQVMATYTRSLEEQQSLSYLKSNQVVDALNRSQYTIYREINKTGDLPSRDLDICPIQISLADMFDFCRSAQELDMTKTGDVRLHCELNIDKLAPVQRMVTATDIPDLDETKKMLDITATGDANTVITGTYFTDGLGNSPYFVGQKCTLSATHTDTGVETHTVIVEEIVWDKTNGGVLELTFTGSWGNLAVSKTYTDITVVPEGFDVPNSTLEINLAEVIIKRVGNPVGVDSIMYDTFSTEQTNGNSLTSFQNQYSVEPDATNVLIAFPDGQDLISVNEDIQSFRLRVNNEDCTDREISVDSPLYYDRLNMTLGNMGYRLKNLHQNYGASDKDYDDAYEQTAVKTTLVANPLFQTDREKFLQVNIEAQGGGVKKLSLFKIRPRTLAF
tara:strand:- start:938 stop:2410 length:1473 start_codon:yes stop_codon:yes gene_type:complete